MSKIEPTEWVPLLLKEIVASDVLARIREDYAAHSDIPLALLGMDSMATMQLVLNLESLVGAQIDYVTFDISVLRTLGSIEGYLEKAKDGDL